MFIVTWIFGKLGYIPKINCEVGKINLDLKDTWPFPAETPKAEPKTKPKVAKKPTVKRATTRKPKAK